MISAEEFKAEVKALAEKIGVKPSEIHLRNMSRKWGSCSSRGRLTFNTKVGAGGLVGAGGSR